MVNIIGWIIWGILLFVTFSFSYGIIRSVQRKNPFTYSILIQAIISWITLLIFYFYPTLNKLNILWVAPMYFFLISFIVNSYFINKN